MGTEIVLISLLTIVASLIGTVTGFGTSTVMVPVVALFLPLPQTLLFVGIIHTLGDIWKLVFFRTGIRWKLILLFGIPAVGASLLGAALSLSAPESALSQVLGVFLILYALFVMAAPTFRLPAKPTTAVTGGVLSGFFAGIFGIGGPPRAAFLSAFDLPKAVYLSTIGAIALATDLTRLVAYASGGTFLAPWMWWGMIAFLPASLCGAEVGRVFVKKIPQETFRWVVLVFLLLVGIFLVVNP